MITTENAYNLRFERGLRLPVNKKYENECLAEIAKRQGELLDELAELDKELFFLYQKRCVDSMKPDDSDLPGRTTFVNAVQASPRRLAGGDLPGQTTFVFKE